MSTGRQRLGGIRLALRPDGCPKWL